MLKYYLRHMKPISMRWTLLICVLISVIDADAQHMYNGRKDKLPENRFRFGAIGGTLVGQIDGDYYLGFYKWGWYGGLKGEAIINKTFSLETNLAFVESGSQFEPWPIEDPLDTRPDRSINLYYVEIPVICKIRWPIGKWNAGLELGMSFMTLFNSKVVEDDISRRYLVYTELQEDFDSSMQSILLGAEMQYERFSVSLRLNNALKPFYRNENFTNLYDYENGRYAIEKMRAYYISLVGAYTLFGDFSDRK